MLLVHCFCYPALCLSLYLVHAVRNILKYGTVVVVTRYNNGWYDSIHVKMILAMVFVYVVTSFCFIQEKHEQKHNTNILLRLNHAVYGHVYGMGRQFEIVFRIFFYMWSVWQTTVRSESRVTGVWMIQSHYACSIVATCMSVMLMSLIVYALRCKLSIQHRKNIKFLPQHF